MDVSTMRPIPPQEYSSAWSVPAWWKSKKQKNLREKQKSQRPTISLAATFFTQSARLSTGPLPNGIVPCYRTVTAPVINRDLYLNRLIERRENGLIKVVTGIRRCGKSYLLFKLYYQYLLVSGIEASRIITIPLDNDEYEELRESKRLSAYIKKWSKILYSVSISHSGQW